MAEHAIAAIVGQGLLCQPAALSFAASDCASCDAVFEHERQDPCQDSGHAPLQTANSTSMCDQFCSL